MTGPALVERLVEPVPRFDPVELAERMGERHPPTGEQAAAISAPLQPRAVIAGAGSGKTQTMGLRVVWLVANGLVEPHRVLGLTFTRKAAAQLGDRIRRMLRQLLAAHIRRPFLDDAVVVGLRTGEPTVSTYHAYAASLLGEHALRIGVEPSAHLLGEAMTWQYAAEIVSAYDGPLDCLDRTPTTAIDAVLTLAGELAEHLVSADEVQAFCQRLAANLPSTLSPAATDTCVPQGVRTLLRSLNARLELLPLVAAYTKSKRARNAMDYGDQVALAARIARDCPAVGRIERTRYRAVLLDEYQDTGEAQRVLLTALFGRDVAVTAVGDPRQSIYGWRGASAGNLERFPGDFLDRSGSTQASALTFSFRNGDSILAVANRLATGIPLRGVGTRPLRPGRDTDPGRVVAALHDSVEDEARWVAEQVAGMRGSRPWGQVAVLARRRAAIPLLEQQLRALGVPCEVVGLGGLLLEPEVRDVVSTLRVLADPTAGNAVVRLLTGPRWRLGPRDLDALGRRARRLVAAMDLQAGAQEPAREAVVPEAEEADGRSLVDALDDPGPPGAYSCTGYARILQLRDELRELRRWTAQPLPDLIAAVVRVLGLDVELAASPGAPAGGGLENLDRLAEVAEEFVLAEEGDPGLFAFLAYLAAAEEQERGLEVDVAEPDADRVQLLTVHAAKGLEWDAVVVTGLTRQVFPVEGQVVTNWIKQPETLPFPLRGDRSELPELSLAGQADLKAVGKAVTDFEELCKARARLEERRLAYVAVTRARSLLLCTGYWWDTTTKPRGPSVILEEVREVCAQHDQPPGPWAPRPAQDAVNPVTAQPRVEVWPGDPLGSRRPTLDAAADLVRAAAPAEPAKSDRPGKDRLAAATGGMAHRGRHLAGSGRPRQWAQEAGLLLAELEQAGPGRSGSEAVELPDHLSVSQLVLLHADPQELARRLRRPLPARPQPLARRGTRFHLWLEQRWGQPRLLDVDELPGAADANAEPDADLAALQEAFLRSPWATRNPAEVEFPFDMTLAGIVLRGRVDAVFTDDPDGFVDVVDWKTGAPPSGPAAESAAVQLAAYRLAWSALSGTPLPRVRAAFHYVRTGRTVRPADLLDAEALSALIRAVPARSGE